MQLYRNSIGGDSIGLIMMDEAFNNMDDERMSGVLSLRLCTQSFRRLPICISKIWIAGASGYGRLYVSEPAYLSGHS